jgi:anti-sigma regulatory factor (Ser/Thr protein kinase)
VVTSDSAVRQYPPDLSCVAQARAFVRDALDGAVSGEQLAEIELVVSELVTNAIVHAAEPVELTVQANGVVRVEVVDPAPAQPAKRLPEANSESGRGLHIVEAVCDRSGVHVVTHGKCVWCEVDLEAGS